MPGKILIVDDNELNLAILEELLSDNYETVSAESGEQAISVAPVHSSSPNVRCQVWPPSVVL